MLAQQYLTATLQDLLAITARECGEALVVLNELEPCMRCLPKSVGKEAVSPHILVRESVRDKIRDVQTFLEQRDPHHTLVISYGYRSQRVQKELYDKALLACQKCDPDLSQEALEEKAHLFIAHPQVAGHSTGGAVDATLYYDQQEIDMGTPLYEFEAGNKIMTFSSAISEQEAAYRQILLDAFMSAGFAPFYGKWWHFSYGDKEWAYFYKKKEAIYTPLEEEMICQKTL